MEFLYILLGIVIGVVYGWNARERYASRVLERMATQIMMEQEQEEDEDRIFIDIEVHNGTIFVYNKETKEFMAQGSTRKEIEKVLESRFPGKIFAAPEAQLKVLHDSV
jgi:hypothetical protein